MESSRDSFHTKSEANASFIERFHQLYSESLGLRSQIGVMGITPGLDSPSDFITLLPETSSTEVIYNPTVNNFWMYSMIVLGCAFIVFAIGSIYLLCVSGRQDNDGYRNEKYRRPSAGLVKPKSKRRQHKQSSPSPPYQGATSNNQLSKPNISGRRAKYEDQHSPLD